MLEIVQMPLASLNEYASNAKVHDEANIEAIRASIRRFGNCDPIGVWTAPDGTVEIVEGHGRRAALEAEGYEVADVVFLDHLTDEERRAYALAHNQTTLMTGFDAAILDGELDALNGFDMEDFGFDAIPEEGDMDAFFAAAEPRGEVPDEPHQLQCPHCKMFFAPGR